MHFCPNCKNMFYIKVGEEQPHPLLYYCRNCGTEDSDLGSKEIYVSKVQVTNNEINYAHRINPYTKFDPTLPHVSNVPCPNEACACNKAVGEEGYQERDVILIRYDDTNLHYVYLCTHCDTIWKN